MNPAPLLLFAYNRLKHTKGTIEALQKNNLAGATELFVFSDNAKKEIDQAAVSEVRNYIKTVKGFKEVYIFERDSNFGLGKNIIDGVTRIVNERGRAIVLEDDLITSPFFLEYINQGLEIYENEETVASIHGYCYPVTKKLPETFFIRGADCLGWGVWKRSWSLFEPDGNKLLQKLVDSKQTSLFDYNDSYPFTQMLRDQIAGKNNSWAIRWYASAFINNKFTLYPGRSLVFHAGGDGSGTNVGIDDVYDVGLSFTPIKMTKLEVRQNEEAYKAFEQFQYKLSHPPLLYRVRRKLKQLFIHPAN